MASRRQFPLAPSLGGLERPLIAELRHVLSALRGNCLGFVVLCGASIARGIIALDFLVVASLAFGRLLLLAGLAEALGAFD